MNERVERKKNTHTHTQKAKKKQKKTTEHKITERKRLKVQSYPTTH